MKIEKTRSLMEILASFPMAMFKIMLILALEVVMFGGLLFCGLVSGKMLVHNYYKIFGVAGVITGPTRMFREIFWGAVMMAAIVFAVIIPFEKTVLKPARQALFKQVGIVSDALFAMFDAFILGYAFAQISILFEVRFCLESYKQYLLNGPVSAFIYMLHHFPSCFCQSYQTHDEFEKFIAFPLIVAFTYPLYSFIRGYFETKGSAFSLMFFMEKVLPKPCCCEEKVIMEDESIDCKAQIYGLIVETGEFLSLYISTMALIVAGVIMAGDAHPGFVFVGFGILGFFYALGLVVLENRFSTAFKRARNGVELRILFNVCILIFFVTKTFLTFFEMPEEELCTEGHLEMHTEIAQSFAGRFTISIYSAWKIIFLCVSFYSSDRNMKKWLKMKADKYIWKVLSVQKSGALPTFQRPDIKESPILAQPQPLQFGCASPLCIMKEKKEEASAEKVVDEESPKSTNY